MALRVRKSGPPVKALLVIPGPALASGLRQIVEGSGHPIGIEVAANADDALALVGRAPPDVVLLDAQLPDHGGFVLCRRLIALRPQLAVLLLTSLDWDFVLAESWKAGAVGVLSKDAGVDDYVDAITHAASGARLFTAEQRLNIRAWEQAVGWTLDALTGREWDIVRLMAKGRSNQDISDQLVITVKTVEKHVSSILSKVGVRSRAELLVFLLEHHLEV